MRILVADDHGIVRSGIKLLLDLQPDLEVVAEAADGIEAVEAALSSRPNLCILDVGMPRMTGLQAAREIRSHLPEARVLILSMHDDEHYLFEALKAGASGYVLKREADQDLVGAIRAVDRGEAFLTNAAERSIIRRWMADGARVPRSRSRPARKRWSARRRSLHERADRRTPPSLREDRRVTSRQRPAQARHARPRRAPSLRDPPRPDRGILPPIARPDHLVDLALPSSIARRARPGRPHPCPAVPGPLPWINVATLRMDQQRGRPVLIEFWDFCRPNSIRTLPYMRAWHERYGPAGLSVIGVHSSGFPPSVTPMRSRPPWPGSRSRIRSWSMPSTRSGSNTATSAGPRATCSTRRAAVRLPLRRGRLRRDRAGDPGAARIAESRWSPLSRRGRARRAARAAERGRRRPYSGPYEAGGVWAVLDGNGSVRPTAGRSRSTIPAPTS